MPGGARGRRIERPPHANPPLPPRLATVGGVLSLWAILAICLVPTGSAAPDGVMVCLVCGDDGLADLLLNIVLYLPLGFFVRARTGSLRLTVAVGFLLSLGVETAQLAIPGRFTTLADLLANTTGALLGGLLGRTPRAWILPPPPAGRWLAPILSVAAALALVVPAALLVPAPPPGILWGNWTPRMASMAPYEGRILEASIDGILLPSRALPPEDSDRVRAGLLQGSPLLLRVEAGPPPAGTATLFRLLDGEGRAAIGVQVRGGELRVAHRIRADDLHLDRPVLRAPGLLDGIHAGDTVTIAISVPPGGGLGVELQDASGGVRSASLSVPPGRGWALLHHPRWLPPGAPPLADLLWVVFLLFPLAWWAGDRGRARLGAILPVLALAFVPLAGPLAPTPFAHYLAALATVSLAPRLRAILATRW